MVTCVWVPPYDTALLKCWSPGLCIAAVCAEAIHPGNGVCESHEKAGVLVRSRSKKRLLYPSTHLSKPCSGAARIYAHLRAKGVESLRRFGSRCIELAFVDRALRLLLNPNWFQGILVASGVERGRSIHASVVGSVGHGGPQWFSMNAIGYPITTALWPTRTLRSPKVSGALDSMPQPSQRCAHWLLTTSLESTKSGPIGRCLPSLVLEQGGLRLLRGKLI